MLIRLLVAVLMLVGPMPFRVCTCAASVPVAYPTDTLTSPAPVKARTCGCANHEPAKGTLSTEHDARATADAGTRSCGESHSNRHERDCPTVTPRPLAGEAVAPPAPNESVDSGVSLDLCRLESAPLTLDPVAIPSERPHAPRTPLYITFLSLRN